ncbi:MAG: OmpA family protein [Saprospiraceae bacterium]
MTLTRWIVLLSIVCSSGLKAQPSGVFDSLSLVHADTFYFDTGVHELTDSVRLALEHYPLPQKASDRLYITGHTDADGSAEANEKLAIRRADAVSELLSGRGWPQDRIVVQTFGERNPVAGNASLAGKQKNRRVTLARYQAIPYTYTKGRIVNTKREKGWRIFMCIFTIVLSAIHCDREKAVILAQYSPLTP